MLGTCGCRNIFAACFEPRSDVYGLSVSFCDFGGFRGATSMIPDVDHAARNNRARHTKKQWKYAWLRPGCLQNPKKTMVHRHFR